MNRDLGFKVRIMLLMVASGISNAYCVMNFKTPVTHHTGNATAIALSIHDRKRLIFLLTVFGLFFLGSLVGAYITHGDNFRLGFICMTGLAMLPILREIMQCTYSHLFLDSKTLYLLSTTESL